MLTIAIRSTSVADDGQDGSAETSQAHLRLFGDESV